MSTSCSATQLLLDPVIQNLLPITPTWSNMNNRKVLHDTSRSLKFLQMRLTKRVSEMHLIPLANLCLENLRAKAKMMILCENTATILTINGIVLADIKLEVFRTLKFFELLLDWYHHHKTENSNYNDSTSLFPDPLKKISPFS